MDNYGRMLDEQRFDLAVNRAASAAVLATARSRASPQQSAGLRGWPARRRRVAEVFSPATTPMGRLRHRDVPVRAGPIPGIWPAIDRRAGSM
jgi:hypothetical protein